MLRQSPVALIDNHLPVFRRFCWGFKDFGSLV